MKRMMGAALAAPLMLAAFPACAASPFDGTWKADVAAAQLSDKPDVYLLQDGVYTCKTCTPPFHVRADGAFHPVSGQSYFDSASVKVVNAHTTIETHRKAGKVMSVATFTVSPDGKTGIFSFRDMSAPNGKVVTGKGTQTLVTPGPKGSHATSGAWRTEKIDSVSDAGIIMMLKDDGKALSMSTPGGYDYVASYDGPAVVVKGDPGGTSVSVKKPDAHTIVETDMRDGKTVSRLTMKVDGAGAMTAISEDTQRGTSTTFPLKRQ